MRIRTSVALAAATIPIATAAAPVLMRYPTASRDAVAFVARGEVWVTGRDGGRSRRLTQGPGHALTARFSPDGGRIAYTRRVAGGQDVWVVPAAGGTPVRLTHDGPTRASGNLVLGWTPDGARVVFLSQRQAVAAGQLRAFAVPAGGGLAERLPLGQSGLVDIAADGRIAYTATFTEDALRKRYLGGRAEEIFVYDPKTRRRERVTRWKGTDGFPMWAPGAIWFLSDRGANFRLNIWRHDLATGAERQVTRFTDYDIDWPSMGGGRIVFQQGGRLWALDLASERLAALKVDVPDDGALTAPREVAVGGQAREADVTGAIDYAIAPDGGAALIAARGDLFRVATAGGGATNLTATPDRDEDHPAFSPDGATIAYATEDGRSGQVAARPAAGGAPRVLTRFTDAVPYAPAFAPDGRRLAVPDAQHRLWLVALDGTAPSLVAHDPLGDIRDAAFSPDGAWLAYSMMRPSGLRALHLRRLADGRDIVVSGDLDGDRLPVFSADGGSLYFVSQRHDTVVTGDRGDEASIATIASDGVYVAAIDGDPATLMRRAREVPVAAGRIASLAVRGGSLFYERRPLAWIGGDLPGGGAELHRVIGDLDDVVLRDFDGQALSGDGRHLLYRRDGTWRTATIGGDDRALDVAGMRMRVDPRSEWRAMVDQAWRLDRDLFFSRVMNGGDWPAVRAAYARLVPLIGSRADAQYVVAQVQGELATSHGFMGGLDADAPGQGRPPSRLGADLVLDPVSGRYRFGKVYRGDPSRPRFRAPLDDPGTGARVADGDYLLGVNGVRLAAPIDPDALLAASTGTIALTVASAPNGPSRTLRVSPLAAELDLRQYDWVEGNRARVAALSGGRVGYVFLGDFDADGSRDLARQLQGQLDRDGLVIDLRWNRGGYTSQAVLNLLRRVRAGVFVNRDRATTSLPLLVSPPAMTVIVNADSGSDGDQFPYFFKRLGLGTVIGQRTWGGVQGIKGPWPLIDGTTITIPKDSLAVDGRWVIENTGTEPDVTVDPAPDEIATGRDAMLEAAVRDVLARAPTGPRTQPAPPPLPAYPAAGDVPGARF